MRGTGHLTSNNRCSKWASLAVAAVIVAFPPGTAGADEPGLTGATKPGDVVQARQLLMEAIEAEMMPIDFAVGGKELPLKSLQDHAYLINTLIAAFPHLFPPRTGPDAGMDEWPSPTNALPAVWITFDAFYDLARTAAEQALAASQASDLAAFREAGKALRGSCDSCHAKYLKQ